MNSHRPINLRAFLITASIAALAFLGLDAVAFTRPSHKTKTVNVPYTQQVSFAYDGTAPAGPVYPSGAVHTGDPIFLQFVHQLHVQVAYTLAASAPEQLAGTQQVLLRLSGPTGWSRTLPLSAAKHFTGAHASTVVALDLNNLQSLIKRIQKLTGVAAATGYTISVVPQVHVHGTLAGRPLASSFSPALGFQLAPPQLRTSATRAVAHGAVQSTSSVANTLASVNVKTLRAVALGGLVLSLLVALLLFVLIKRSEPFGEAGRIQAQYGHLIVPIAGTADDLAWAPFDVPNIESLVRLAEACNRLILHYREDTLDTYLVNDEGTVYRYQSRHSGVVWGEWSTAPVARLDSVPPPSVAKEAA